MALFDIRGKNAIVTGASRGLGAAAAEALAEAGANVAVIGRDMQTLHERSEELSRFGTHILPVVCDTSVPLQIIDSVRHIHNTFGTIDILVNNAGIIRRAAAQDYTQADWDQVIAVNQTGIFRMAQEAGRIMIAQGHGKIINIASLLSFSGGLNVVAYTASKHAVAGITRSLANEWAKYGLNVNAIAPGYFITEATAALRSDSERYNALLKRIPAGRFGEPYEIQGTILYLASSASNYLNGHILTLDGGWMAA